MKELLSKLPATYPLIITQKELQESISDEQMRSLIDQKLLVQTEYLREVICKTCGSAHKINFSVDGERAYYFCPEDDTGREHVEKTEILRWKFELRKLLTIISKRLQLKGTVAESKPEQLWSMGKLSTGHGYIQTYYYRGSNNELGDLNIEENTCIILCHSQNSAVYTMENKHLLYVPIDAIVAYTKKGVTVSSSYLTDEINTYMKRVLLDTENGDLIVDGVILVSVSLHTRESYFLECLYQNFNKPVSHEDIYSYCKDKMSYEYGDTPQQFSNKQKSEISKKVLDKHKSLFEEILHKSKTKKGENAYILHDPQ